MLKPKYLEQLPENMVKLCAQAEQDILADAARRISTYDYWIPAADHQYRKLIEMGNFHSYVMESLSSRTGKSRAELERLMQEAGQKALAFDTSIYKQHGLKPPPLAASVGLQRILKAGLEKTNGLFSNLTGTTANTVTKQFENALDRAYMQITTGAFDYNTAIRMAVKDLAQQGVGSVMYASGRVDTIETAVRRAVVTGVNQTALRLQWSLADEMGCDLVETTAHAGARPEHALWQGQIFSRSGKSLVYPEFASSTGYGSGAGLGGWNCRHSFFPYFEGTARTYTPEMLKEFDAKTYTYNGQRMTEYEASQKQRYIERKIRRWKREEAAMKAAGQPTHEASAKVRQWQSTQRDFLKQTGLKRQSAREQVAKINLSGRIKTRTMASGMRKPPTHVLTDAEISEIRKDILAINADITVFRFNSGRRTGYVDESDIVNIRGDVLPDLDSRHPRDLMSIRAVLAHEYYGHRANRGTTLVPGAWNDEFRASYMAARDCPGLSDEDRQFLILDALERAKEANIPIKYNSFIREVLYGY